MKHANKVVRRSNIPVPQIERHIYTIRGQRVMLDRDLAKLYDVRPTALRQQVKRNPGRFPKDFTFQLKAREAELLVSQNVTPNRHSFGGHLPYAFTEQGVAMLSSVLTSERAVQVNIAIMRAFVKLRYLLATHEDLARKLDDLEGKFLLHDKQIANVFHAIRKILEPEVPPKRRIGFSTAG